LTRVKGRKPRFTNIPLHCPLFLCAQSLFAKYSLGFIYMPGGFGTLDEFSKS